MFSVYARWRTSATSSITQRKSRVASLHGSTRAKFQVNFRDARLGQLRHGFNLLSAYFAPDNEFFSARTRWTLDQIFTIFYLHRVVHNVSGQPSKRTEKGTGLLCTPICIRRSQELKPALRRSPRPAASEEPAWEACSCSPSDAHGSNPNTGKCALTQILLHAQACGVH